MQPKVQIIAGREMIQKFHTNGRGSDPDMFKKNTFLSPVETPREIHFIIEHDGKVIADAGIEQNPWDADEVWLKHIFVDEKHRQRGHATRILDAVFTYCIENSKALRRSTPTEMGAAYLPSVYEKMFDAHPDVVVRSSGYEMPNKF